MSNPLLTIGEVAVMLRITDKTVRRYIATGALPAYKIGRAARQPVRIRLEDVEALLRPIPSAARQR